MPRPARRHRPGVRSGHHRRHVAHHLRGEKHIVLEHNHPRVVGRQRRPPDAHMRVGAADLARRHRVPRGDVHHWQGRPVEVHLGKWGCIHPRQRQAHVGAHRTHDGRPLRAAGQPNRVDGVDAVPPFGAPLGQPRLCGRRRRVLGIEHQRGGVPHQQPSHGAGAVDISSSMAAVGKRSQPASRQGKDGAEGGAASLKNQGGSASKGGSVSGRDPPTLKLYRPPINAESTECS